MSRSISWPRALASRNFRLYFLGQALSVIGNWMTQTTSLWLAYHLTSSAMLLGVVGFASSAPIFFLAPFAGVWVDRVQRRPLLVWTQTLSMLQSFALAALALSGVITVGQIITLCLLQGAIDAIDGPARMSSLYDFVGDRELLANAIALNSSIFNVARLIGPAIAGLVIAATNPGFCYLVDGFSYIGVIAALMAMQLPARAVKGREARPSAELKSGIQYALHTKPIRTLLLLVASFSALAFSYPVLAPMFAKDIFHGNARTLGWLMSAAGLGAASGSIFLATRKSNSRLSETTIVGGLLMGFGLIAYSFSNLLPLSLGCLVAVGGGGVLLMASAHTSVQLLVDDDKRGRVMSFLTTAFRGVVPWGNLLAGWMAAAMGPRRALQASGLLCLIVMAAFFRKLPSTQAKLPDSPRV